MHHYSAVLSFFCLAIKWVFSAEKFEIGNIYTDNKSGKGGQGTYLVLSRTDKTVTFGNPEKPESQLHQMRKAIQTREEGEYVILTKGTAPSYRDRKKRPGKYMTSYGKDEISIHA